MSDPVTLIVHIGHGKTGSTSIQQTLMQNRDTLAAKGVFYLGRTLEFCETARPYVWQHPDGAVRLLHQMDETEAADEIYNVLKEELERLQTIGARAAIWSNEALFARRESACRALQKLRDEGVPLQVIVYLRRHDKWAKSAYSQWGIRHKSYEGPVMGFKEWIKMRPVHFADNLEFWDQHIGSDLLVQNFDETPDVVQAFMEQIDVEGAEPVRAYDTPPPEALLAWAIYNTRSQGEVQPDTFGRLLRPSGLFWEKPPTLPDMKHFLPDDADLASVLDASSGDMARVNAVFDRHGQKGFETQTPARSSDIPSEWDMMQFMIVMVSSLQEQVLRLKRRIDELEG